MLERTCMGCNKKSIKTELIRLVVQDNKLEVDDTYKIDARGAYVCNEIECFQKCIKTKRIERVLKHSFTQENYNEIRGKKFEGK